MTREEFISWAKSAGAILLPTIEDAGIMRAQNALQQMQAAMLPIALADFYKTIADGAFLGDANIFGIREAARGGSAVYHIPDILQANREIAGLQGMRGKTLFGRNSLFWFAFDAFGHCLMLSNTALSPMRQYDDIYKAMSDCLALGKI
jgi:hypothetical protein